MESLSSCERSAYLRYFKERIIEKCKSMSLPLFVQSTAVAFWSKFPKYDIDVAIALACKANDKDAKTDVCDMDLAEDMGYDFHHPSPYLRMYGLLIILQERSIVANDTIQNRQNNALQINVRHVWEKSVCNMEHVLLIDKQASVNEMAISALELPVEIFTNVFDFDVNVVLDIKKRVSEMRPVCKETLEKALVKISASNAAQKQTNQ